MHIMRIAYFDCIGGIAGDMALGALIDAGAPLDELTTQLHLMAISNWELSIKPAQVGVLAAKRLCVTANDDQPSRHLGDIEKIILTANLPKRATERALKIFRLLAEAEAKVHGSTVDHVHFHEVGAVDAIVDIVGVCLALELLGIDKVYSSALPMGYGTIKSSHGLIPLPAPAVVELLKGKPTYGVNIQGETVTPTGAAIVAALAESFGSQPAMSFEAVGYGAGMRESDIPNIVRAFVGEANTPLAEHEVVLLETNLDDMSPEWAGFLLERLLEAGAFDAHFVPTTMKKGRPGFLLSVLCGPEKKNSLIEIILAESTSFGVRYSTLRRTCLDRRWETVETPYGTIRIKIGEHNSQILTTAPEFEDCRSAALSNNVPLRIVYDIAMETFKAKG
jgi:uncharacterized protein (TIGR00299 family) protein